MTMRRSAIIALWIIGVVSGGFAVFGIMERYGFMPLVRAIAALGFSGLVGFCALLCNYPTVRRTTVIALWIVAIAGGGFAVYGFMGYYDFTPLIRIIAVLVFAEIVVGASCAFLHENHPTLHHTAITVLWIVGTALVVAIIAAFVGHYGFVPVAKVIGVIVWVIAMVALFIGVVIPALESAPKAAASVISSLKSLNPKNTASIIASIAALIFALAIAAIVVVIIIKSF